MNNLTERLSKLNAQQRALLEKQLEKQNLASAKATGIRRRSGAGPWPLSPDQERLWFIDQMFPGSPAYNLASSFRLSGHLNTAELEHSFNEIIRRHESLRTTFLTTEGIPQQVIAPELTIKLSEIDLRHVSNPEREQELRRRTSQFGHQPFDLATGPLLRAALFRLGEREHALVTTLHHIITDRWSYGVLWRELAVLYEAYTRGQFSPLSDLPIQFADYSEWQRQWFCGDVVESQLRYWEKQLKGSSFILELPTDHPRPPAQTFRGKRQYLIPSAALWGKLKALSQRESVTFFTTMLTAFYVWLNRHTGQEDINVGTPFANRKRSETEGLIGYLLNMLVLRADLSGDPTFTELLGRVREVARGAFANSDLPSAKLLQQLRLERDINRNPMFQVSFVMVDFQDSVITLPDLAMTAIEVDTETSRFDLTFAVRDRGSDSDLILEYNTDLFDDATVSCMFKRLELLLEGIADDPARRLSELPLLTKVERSQILTGWNSTTAEYARGDCLQQLFEVQVARTPDLTAVICGERQISFGELNSRANQLAHHLISLGVKPEVCVGICVERSIELVVGLLGILKAGGAYVPLDPHSPADRLALTFEDADTPLLLTRERLRAGLPPTSARIVDLDSDQTLITRCSTENPALRLTADNLAYVIHTSGSTGRPVGVMIRHESAINLLAALERSIYRHHDAGSQLSVSLNAPPTVDASVKQFIQLCVGRTLCIIPEETRRDPHALPDYLQQHEVAVLDCTPTQLSTLLDAGMEQRAELAGLALLVGGEAIAEHLWQRLAGIQGLSFYNVYGPTECTVDATITRVEGTTPNIGRPVANTQVYILGSHNQLVPPGVAGELHIAGAGLARGYLKRPALTAERFRPHPFATAPGERLYKTGDRARYLPDGRIEYLGRLDHQVKVRGYRVELGDIEAALAQHPEVRECAVLFREEHPGKHRLVAYLTYNEGAAPTASALRGFLSAKVPEYMVPSAFVPLAEMPLTPGSKIDRRALPPFGNLGSEGREGFVAPRTEREKLLVEIWERVLGVSRVGIHDNFYELGGDSIQSIQILARANQAGLRLTARQFFQGKTVFELAKMAVAVSRVNAEQDTVTGEVPLTPIQSWFFERQLGETHHFNQSVMLEVSRDCDPALLEQAIHHLLRQHDALRTRFVRDGAVWRQFVASVDEAASFSRANFSSLPSEAQDTAVAAASAELQSSLDLTNGPLLRAAWFDLGRARPSRLVLVIHHLVVDGVSWRILLPDLQLYYEQLSERGVIEPLPKTTSFKHWAQSLTEYARSDKACAEAGYWLEVVRRDSGRLPLDYEGGDNLVATARSLGVSLSKRETQALLRMVPAVYHTRIDDVLLTALASAVRQWTGDGRLLINLEGHGREATVEGVDVSRTVGWFTSVYPVLLDVSETGGEGEALKKVKEQLRRTPAGGIGYGLLKYLGSPDVAAQLREAPGAEIIFNYMGQFDQLAVEASMFTPLRESVGPLRSPRAQRLHALEVTAMVVAEQLQINWTYGEQLHERATVEALAARHLEALRAIIAHCETEGAGGYTPSDFPLAGVDQPTLDRLLHGRAGRRVEDIYPLSPMQQGLLFHSLYAPGQGVYVEQFVCELAGELDRPLFKAAWRQVIGRHASLRARFAWEDLDEPLQIIERAVEMEFEESGWPGQSRAEQEEWLESFLEADRRKGFDLHEAPPMRLTLIQRSHGSYYFIWSHHHILIDGWSLLLLMREVAARYAALCDGETSEPEPSRAYRDYIEWLRRQDLSEAETFWREELKGFSMPTPLGVDAGGAQAARAGEGCGKQRMALSASLLEAMQRAARRFQLTTNTILLGAWSLLLSRYSGEEEIMFGLTTAGRPAEIPDVETMVGLFINTLPLRVRVGTGAMAADWLGQLQHQQMRVRQFDYSPLVMVRGWSEIPKGLPMFESLVVFEDFPRSNFNSEGTAGAGDDAGSASISVVEQKDYSRTNYPLTLTVAPIGGELFVSISYDSFRFDDETVRRMLEHLQCILESLVENPERRVSDLSLLGERERELLLGGWNNTGREFVPACFPALFEAQVEQSPEATAVEFEGERLSYTELNYRSNQLAHHLRRLGVGPEARVIVCLERSVTLLVGLLGVLKAGGAYVPLDPDYPRARLAFMLEDTGGNVLITQESLRERLPRHDGATVLADADWSNISLESDANPAPVATADNLAYVIYTSGSTGQPKGVQITHRALANFLQSMSFSPGLDAGHVVLALTSISFDIAALEFFLPLVTGASVLIISRADATDGEKLRAHVEGLRCGLVQATPATWRMLIDAGWHNPSGVRVLCGGEELPADLARRLLAHVGMVWNMYGPTETTVWSALHQLEVEEESKVLGEPLANTQMYVLDRGGRVTPVGVAGELHVGGAGLSRGYLNRPALTAERFVPDAFGREPGARLYRTGDLVRYLPDGRIEFLGRLDQQVKVHGFRVEPGEIEATLRQVEGVREAVVITAEGGSGEKRLAAFVVCAEGASVGVVELRAHLGESLPEYMMPHVFTQLSEMPLTPNGKIDRRALAGLAQSQPAHVADYVAPATPVEEILCAIWVDVLRLEHVGAQDNFFDLGGHSLLATKVASRVRRAFGIELPLRVLFESPTVAALGEYIKQTVKGLPTVSVPPPVRAEHAGSPPPPLSFAQQRLWFLDELEPGSPFYNLPAALRIDGALDVMALERSLDEIMHRHEVLRTNFYVVDEGPAQVIAHQRQLVLEKVDLSDMPPTEREAAMRRQMDEEARQGFDLARDTLVRARLLRLDVETHVLLITMHHIVCDGWSVGVMVAELGALYEAYRRGGESPLAELEVQYADYAIWQREWLTGDALDVQLHYWKDQLAGAPPVLELPTDRPRPNLQTFVGAQQTFAVPATLTEALKKLNRSEGVTLFMTLLAAFKVLLQRYTEQDDIIVGTPIAGRNRAEIEPLIGFFVNTLVLRSDLGDNPAFQELLRRVRETMLGAYAHQDMPFEKLVEELQPARDLGHAPLFQVMFVLQNAPRQALRLEGVELNVLDVESATTRFDLVLNMRETPDGLSGEVSYNSDLFNAATIERMAAHFQNLLQSAASQPQNPISTLSLSSQAELQQLLFDWNSTGAAYAQHTCIHELFEAQAERTPEVTAVRFEDERLSYGELNRRANQLARYLRRLGARPETRVGICVERSAEMLVGLLGILKAGAAYVPLSPAYPLERLSFIVSDAEVGLFLTQQRLLKDLPEIPGRIVSLDGDLEAISREPVENLLAASADNPAYVIYTSGSMGVPKGVEITHRNLVHSTTARFSYYRDRVGCFLLVSPFVFDSSVAGIFWTLGQGGTLELLPEDSPQDPARIVALIDRQGISHVLCLPSLYGLMLEQADNTQLKSLRSIIVAGEACPVELVRRHYDLLPHAALFNEYGPTEAAVWSTVYECAPHTIQTTIPIGRPIRNMQTYVLDRHFQPVPLGVVGELCIGGDGLARGYLRRPELTAERFVPHPFSDRRGARLYRTGDSARYLEDGHLEYVGRRDHQVKIRGFRVELGEIEVVLKQHSAVAQAAVAVSGDGDGRKRIVAYVVNAQDAPVSVREFRGFLKKRLPEYMLPSAFVFLDELPLTASGKVNRRALPAPESCDARATGEYSAPRTPIEEILTETWAEVLKLSRAGVDDNFFEAGGHSLLATQLMSRVRQVFRIELPLRSLFEHPTPAELAEIIEAELRTGSALAAPPIEPVERVERLPLSFAQQRLWVLEQLESRGGAYNMRSAVRLRGTLRIDAFERALNEVVRRHEALRTIFQMREYNLEQVISEPEPQDIHFNDISSLPPAEHEERIGHLASEEANHPFDLLRGPLLRVRLIRVGEAEHILLLTAHHVVSDGWSMGLIVRELATLYEAFSSGEPSPLPELPIQYADYAAWQRQWLESDALSEQLAYWKAQLGGELPVLDLLADKPRPAVQTYQGAQHSALLSPEIHGRLKELTRREGVTLYMALLAVFKVLLMRYSGETDIIIGTPIAGRNRAEVEPLVGLFLNTLVLRTDLSGDPTFAELLGRVREVALSAYANQDLPFEHLLEELSPPRDLSRTPLFQVMFNFLNFPAEPITLSELTLHREETPESFSKFDLTLYAAEVGGALRLRLVYNPALYESQTVSRMLGHLTHLLDGVSRDPRLRLSALELPVEGRRHAPSLPAKGPFIEFSHDAIEQSLPARFAEQALAHHGKVALRARDSVWTYGELRDASNRLTQRLLGRGEGQKIERVALLFDHSPEMIAAMFGVLGAGHCYVPLDAAHPPERLAYMAADAGVSTLVTCGRKMELAVALQASGGQLEVIRVDELPPAPARLVPEVPPERLAYILYTSGSTGRPKGVMQSHRNVLHHVRSYTNALRIHADDRLTLLASYGFDAAVMDIYGALLNGATLCLRNVREEDPAGMSRWLRDEGVTIYHSTPTLYRSFVAGARGGERLENVRFVVLGGEEVSREDVENFRRRFGDDSILVNGLGPTESTTALQYFVDSRTPLGGRRVPVGYAVAETTVQLVGRGGEEVKGCGVGELVICSEHVALGYWGKEEETAAVFSGEPRSGGGHRRYRTGDFGRRLGDGSIEYLGRRDEQVKIGGVRVEPFEVRSALMSHKAIRECAVVAHEYEDDRRLVAYFVAEGRQPTAEELREYLRRDLPGYMIPSAFVALESLPLTVHGKLNRGALLAPVHTIAEESEESVAPLTHVESVVAGVWAEVLRVKRVGREDNFFDLGGQSLLATRITWRLREYFQIDVPLRVVLQEAPTVAGTALTIERILAEEIDALTEDEVNEVLSRHCLNVNAE